MTRPRHLPGGPARTDIEFAARIDCEKNGCSEPHGDNGDLLYGRSERIETVNGHAVTVLKRTVTYSEWEET